jgi:hypothetical protein
MVTYKNKQLCFWVITYLLTYFVNSSKLPKMQYFLNIFILYLTRQISYEQILIYIDSLPLPNPDPEMLLGQLCAALRDSQSRPVMKQPGFEPGSVALEMF